MVRLVVAGIWLTLASVLELAAAITASLDTSRPLARFSPSRGTADPLYAGDRFGYAAAIHHTSADLSDKSLQDVLAQVRIIVGAPEGRFPGGLDSLFPSKLTDSTICAAKGLPSSTTEEIRMCYGVTGLVYDCPLTSGNCTALLGNMDEDAADGYLFRRTMSRDLATLIQEYPDDGRMGSVMYSSGEYFVVCAPQFSYLQMSTSGPIYQPRGRCVYSGRDLEGFQILDPCTVTDNLYRGSPTNQGNGGFCQSGYSAIISKSPPTIVVGTPGFSNSRGGLGVYSDLTSTASSPLEGIEAVSQPLYPVMGIDHDPTYSDDPYVYFGSSVTVGNFNGSEGFVASSQRYSSVTNSPGRVSFIKNFGIDGPADLENILGSQVGESFGYSMESADLNGDGYDELLVSAPTYGESQKPEVGRVIVLLNVGMGGSFEKNAVLVGNTRLGRFGHAITCLGDLNNDGYEDVAISAPFENGGVVYIYYGRDAELVVHQTPTLTIRASDMVSRVSGLSSLTTFGIFLQGNTDIDNNQYQDLLIGAEESQAVFVLRSIPVANVELTVSTNVTAVSPIDRSCQFGSDRYPCFEITVCGHYTGRGLVAFSATYSVSENIFRSQNRLLFEKTTGILSFTKAGEEGTICDSLTAYVTATVSDDLQNVSLAVQMNQFERPTSQVDTELQFSDLSAEPVIESEAVVAQVMLLVDCGEDEVCFSDVGIDIDTFIYLTSEDVPHSNQDQLTVGAVTSVEMRVFYFNLNESALTLQLNLTVPTIFTSLSMMSDVGAITCLRGEEMNNLYEQFVCTGFRLPMEPGQNETLVLRWRVSDILIGNEDPFNISLEVGITQRAENMEMNLENNRMDYTVPVGAAAVYNLAVLYQGSPPTYSNEEIAPVVNQTGDLGNPIPITVTFTNSGPSMLPRASMTILLPLRNPDDTREFYYLYPIEIEEINNPNEMAIRCLTNQELNPDGLVITPNTKRRKRQSFQSRNDPITASSFLRTLRQTETVNFDCSVSPEECSIVTCDLRAIEPGDSRVVLIRTLIDSRFFFDKTENYTLTTYVEVDIEDESSFIDTTGSTSVVTAPLTIRNVLLPSEAGGIPIWVYAVCVISGLVFIILLAVFLVLLIALHIRRRRKHKEGRKEEAEEEEIIEVFDGEAFSTPERSS